MSTRKGVFAARPRHHTSHATLLRSLPPVPAVTGNTGRLDAIVVPAARRAHRLRHVIDLAVACETQLVILASHSCDLQEAADLVAATPGCRALIAHVAPEPASGLLGLKTSAEIFSRLSAGRQSNLSTKRNAGLALARLLGWRKIMFLDDDILSLAPDLVSRVAHHLERHRIAGLRTTSMPDNSVVCHANRLSGRPQGIFVSGAALGVNCADVPLDVFPDIYNEDWFAMAREAEAGGVGHAGNARQLEFNPFADPERAAREEFGDVLAEGLFALLADGYDISRAKTAGYWDGFIASRRQLIDRLTRQWRQVHTNESAQVRESLLRAGEQLQLVGRYDCVDFIGAWQHDRDRFALETAGLQAGTPVEDAFAQLGLHTWREVRFRGPDTVLTVPGGTLRSVCRAAVLAVGDRQPQALLQPPGAVRQGLTLPRRLEPERLVEGAGHGVGLDHPHQDLRRARPLLPVDEPAHQRPGHTDPAVRRRRPHRLDVRWLGPVPRHPAQPDLVVVP